jgi:hypothetical protein
MVGARGFEPPTTCTPWSAVIKKNQQLNIHFGKILPRFYPLFLLGFVQVFCQPSNPEKNLPIPVFGVGFTGLGRI